MQLAWVLWKTAQRGDVMKKNGKAESRMLDQIIFDLWAESWSFQDMGIWGRAF